MNRALVATVLLAACTPMPAEDYRGVLPDERLRIDFPDSGAARSAAGDPSDYHRLTATVTHDVNALIDTVLTSIGYVTDFTPTWMDEEATTALWGPWSDNGVDARLWVAHHVDDDSYTWALEARPTGGTEDDWAALVAGEVDAGATETTGSGRFGVDLAAIAALDPTQALTGTFYTDYDVQDDHVVATAGFEGLSEDGGQLADAAYHYEQTIGVEGRMDLAVLTDATGNLTPELHIVRSRWLADGAGRADAYLTDGDFGELVYTATECWDPAKQVVFYEDNATLTTSGDVEMCVFDAPEFNEAEAPGA